CFNRTVTPVEFLTGYVELYGRQLKGVIMAAGSGQSHVSFAAHARGIPLYVVNSLEKLTPGAEAIMSGGKIVVWPGPKVREETAKKVVEDDKYKAGVSARGQAALASKGHVSRVWVNVDGAVEIALGIEAGAYGVGLVRTEGFYVGEDPLTLENMFSMCVAILKAAGP
ncbi:MAG: hypothetical protein HQL18_04635, partial [Candidatus Omnitrophica bacterium]|nr:hypothetical protein [Candidatus Omnitrophota bacterium]